MTFVARYRKFLQDPAERFGGSWTTWSARLRYDSFQLSSSATGV
jgi:hypothetical protein